MADFGDTTGMQNPIFKIMQSQAGGAQNSQGMGQNPMNLNPNSMQQPQMGMNQMGNQMGNNAMNNQMPGMDMNNQQQQAQQPGMNLGTNQMPGQPNPMAQMGMGNNMPQQTGVNPMAQMMNQSGMNPQMAQQMNPQMTQQMMGNNGAMMGNNGAMMGNNGAMDMQQQMMAQQMMQQQQMMAQQQMMQQQQMMAQQMMAQQQQMMAAQQAARQTQMNNILNNMGQGQVNNPPMNQTMPQNQAQQPSGQGFSVIFRASGDAGQNSAPVMIQCMPHEKVSELIERYRNKTGDRDPQKKFIFNAKNLAPSLSLSEAGISNNANIFVVATKGIKGAF